MGGLVLFETEEQRSFRDTCARFAAREIAPLVDEAESTGVYPRILRKKAAEIGLLGLGVPEAFGGTESGLWERCIMIEECAKVCAGLCTGLLGLGQNLLPQLGTPAQFERYLKPLVHGDKASAFAMTEPNAGSDVLAMNGRAERTSTGWRIRANKLYITGAPCSDFMIVVVYTDRDARRNGVSIFLVDSDTPGVDIQKMDKLGHRSMETGNVFLDCEVPSDALLGEAGRGMDYVMSVLEEGRITHAARSLGVARAGYEAALSYSGMRETFGVPIMQHQAIQMKLAQMLIELRSAHLHVYSAASRKDAEMPALLDASMAKVVASEAAVSITDQAMRIFAGVGYINDAPVQRYFRDARLYPITEGTTEIQLRTIARTAVLQQEN